MVHNVPDKTTEDVFRAVMDQNGISPQDYDVAWANHACGPEVTWPPDVAAEGRTLQTYDARDAFSEIADDHEYLLRLPRELYVALKDAAHDQRITMREYILNAIAGRLAG
jgi:hypothetical protein